MKSSSHEIQTTKSSPIFVQSVSYIMDSSSKIKGRFLTESDDNHQVKMDIGKTKDGGLKVSIKVDPKIEVTAMELTIPKNHMVGLNVEATYTAVLKKPAKTE